MLRAIPAGRPFWQRWGLWVLGFTAAVATILGAIALAVQAWDARPTPPLGTRRRAEEPERSEAAG